MRISVLIDNPASWFHDFSKELLRVLKKHDKHCKIVADVDATNGSDILFVLSCDRLLKKSELALHKHNIVVHASDLPRGRGWSPLTWQVEKGFRNIPITLFEAHQGCDTGDYYLKDKIPLDGSELIEELREKLAKKVIAMIERFLRQYPMKAMPQKGTVTHYRRRRPEDNALNVSMNLKDQFNKLRVADNERYPAYFLFKGNKYILKIYKSNKEVR
ncbi:MAG: methionyl-tRNA formyltransferase [Candidatus Omnitrophica bacterium]|nr:methionyl-tRNA formyltransferase [Candidatus Omnitrophota bacterium]